MLLSRCALPRYFYRRGYHGRQNNLVQLPEDLYAERVAQAMRAGQSVDELAAQTLAERIPPASDAELAPALQTDRGAMSQLSADALWAIAGSVVNADKLALYDLLIERQNTGPLTPDGKQLLSQLRNEADALMLRKAEAYALLRQRGHTLPSLGDLHVDL